MVSFLLLECMNGTPTTKYSYDTLYCISYSAKMFVLTFVKSSDSFLSYRQIKLNSYLTAIHVVDGSTLVNLTISSN